MGQASTQMGSLPASTRPRQPSHLRMMRSVRLKLGAL